MVSGSEEFRSHFSYWPGRFSAVLCSTRVLPMNLLCPSASSGGFASKIAWDKLAVDTCNLLSSCISPLIRVGCKTAILDQLPDVFTARVR